MYGKVTSLETAVFERSIYYSHFRRERYSHATRGRVERARARASQEAGGPRGSSGLRLCYHGGGSVLGSDFLYWAGSETDIRSVWGVCNATSACLGRKRVVNNFGHEFGSAITGCQIQNLRKCA